MKCYFQYKGQKYDSINDLIPIVHREMIRGKGIVQKEEIKNTVNTDNSSTSDYINHSGGAKQSDSEWDIIGRKYGVINHNHYYDASAWKTPLGNVPLDENQMQEGINEVSKTYSVLGRPKVTKYLPLHGRNWFQVKNADAVFAISNILSPNEIDKKGYLTKSKKQVVEGGTGYAVEMVKYQQQKQTQY